MDPMSIKLAEKAIEVVADKAYDDTLHPTAKELGDVGGRTTRVLLAPLRGMLWCWERIEETIYEGINKRLENIPEGQLKSPDPEIAVPLIQSLQYTCQNETLREMYLNLLANSMDKGKAKVVHPSYVGIIRKMNSLDAILFRHLTEKDEKYIGLVCPRIEVGDKKVLAYALPIWFFGEYPEGYGYFDVSTSLVRLEKFGLIDLHSDKTKNDYDYDKLRNHSQLHKSLEKAREIHKDKEVVLKTEKGICEINEYGRQFYEAVIEEED